MNRNTERKGVEFIPIPRNGIWGKSMTSQHAHIADPSTLSEASTVGTVLNHIILTLEEFGLMATA